MRENYARLDEVLTECYLIGKWENGDVDQRKFTNSCGRFFFGGAQEKSLKSCWWFPGELPFYSGAIFFYSFGWSFGRSSVGELLELWILASVASPPTLLVLPILDPPLLDLPILDLLLLDLLHKQVVVFYFTFHWHLEVLKRKGLFFFAFSPSPSWASCLTRNKKCFLHRFVIWVRLKICLLANYLHFPGNIARAFVIFRFGSISLVVSLASVPIQYVVRSRKLKKSLAKLYLPFVGGYAVFHGLRLSFVFFCFV